MANAFSVTSVTVQSMLTALNTALNAGTAAVLEIYSGTVPADADATNTGTLLARLTCTKPFGTVTASGTTAVLTAAAITSATASATGTAAFFRLVTQSGGTVIAQGTVGTSAADLILNTVAITSGSTVSVTSATITLPRE